MSYGARQHRDRFPDRPHKLRYTRRNGKIRYLTLGKLYDVSWPGSHGWRVSLTDDRGQQTSWSVEWFSREEEPWAGI